MIIGKTELETLLSLRGKFPDMFITGSVAWGSDDPNDLDVVVKNQGNDFTWLGANGYETVVNENYMDSDPSIIAVFKAYFAPIHIQLVSEDWFEVKRRVQETLLVMFPWYIWKLMSKLSKRLLWRIFLEIDYRRFHGS